MPADRLRSEEAIPLVEERLIVDKREVETGRVRVSTLVDERSELVRETLFSQEAVVDRVRVGRDVDHVPEPRWEGDLLIVPVVEEVLVVEKRLRLVEEVHVRVQRFETGVEEAVTLRSTRAVVERGRPREGAPETASEDYRRDR